MDPLSPATPLPGYTVGAGITPFPDLSPPPTTGKLCLQLLGVFRPETDLLHQAPGTPRPVERWAPVDRQALLNIGGHRLTAVGQEIVFDGRDSQTDEDGVVTRIDWNFGDGGFATGMVVRHTYQSAGLYTVTATGGGATTSRWVRVVNDFADSAFEVIALEELAGSVETGWRCRFTIRGDATSIANGTGVILYTHDDLNVGWRDTYRTLIRDLARRTAFGAVPPPIPPPGDPADPHYTMLGTPSGGCWDPALRFSGAIQQASARTGVPPNLLLSLIYALSCGNPNKTTSTGNPECPQAIGLFQIARGCMWYGHEGVNLYDATQNIEAAAKELAARYRECQSWDGAIVGFYADRCLCNHDPGISQPVPDCLFLELVKDLWAEADRAVGGGSEDRFGETVFQGYVLEGGVSYDREQHQTTISCVDPLAFLTVMQQRQESFFEDDAGRHAEGGTFMVEPPLRVAQAIHHTLTVHTNVADWHDVVLDWSGPRMAQLTAPSGTTVDAFRAWARNDFAWVFADRFGRIRYERRPSYRGREWYEEAVRYARAIDPTLVFNVEVTERRLADRVGWVKLAGTGTASHCQVFGEFPCLESVLTPIDGEWVYETGYQYDDVHVLCAMAAHHYAALNRRWDLKLTLPWRHDLELGDIIRFPHRDPSGRYNWRGVNAPIFVITGLSQSYDTAAASWVTTLEAELITYGVPCDCPEPVCPDVPGTNVPCPRCPSGPGQRTCSGQTLENTWHTYQRERSSGQYLVNQIVLGSNTWSVREFTYGFEGPVVDCECIGGPSECTCWCAQTTADMVMVDASTRTVIDNDFPSLDQRTENYPDEITITTGEGTPGILSAVYEIRRETQIAPSWKPIGGGVAHAEHVREQNSWVTVKAHGFDNNGQRLRIRVRPIAGTPGSTGLLAIRAVGRAPTSDPFGLVGTNLFAIPADKEDGGHGGPLGETTIIGMIPAEPIDSWLTFDITLPSTPSGKRFAIGFARVIPPPEEKVLSRTTRQMLLKGSVSGRGIIGDCKPVDLISTPDDPYICCLDPVCFPRFTGPIHAWLSETTSGTRNLDNFLTSSVNEQCRIATVLTSSAHPYILGPHGSKTDDSGGWCYGSCSITQTPVWLDIESFQTIGSITAQIELDWSLGCAPGFSVPGSGSRPPGGSSRYPGTWTCGTTGGWEESGGGGTITGEENACGSRCIVPEADDWILLPGTDGGMSAGTGTLMLFGEGSTDPDVRYVGHCAPSSRDTKVTFRCRVDFDWIGDPALDAPEFAVSFRRRGNPWWLTPAIVFEAVWYADGTWGALYLYGDEDFEEVEIPPHWVWQGFHLELVWDPSVGRVFYDFGRGTRTGSFDGYPTDRWLEISFAKATTNTAYVTEIEICFDDRNEGCRQQSFSGRWVTESGTWAAQGNTLTATAGPGTIAYEAFEIPGSEHPKPFVLKAHVELDTSQDACTLGIRAGNQLYAVTVGAGAQLCVPGSCWSIQHSSALSWDVTLGWNGVALIATLEQGNERVVATSRGAPAAQGGPWIVVCQSGGQGTGFTVSDIDIGYGECAIPPQHGETGETARIGCGVPGSCGNWPTAAAIDNRIAKSESVNGRVSPLRGMGSTFLELGAKYGVNPGVVTAILQRESQLGTDGSYLPSQANNFGGVTGSGPCGSVFFIDRNWAVYCSPRQGLEGVFALLTQPQYTSTNGSMGAVMEVYAPSFENDVNAMWATFRAVGADLGIVLEPSTPVYSSSPGCGTSGGGLPLPSPPSGGAGYGGYTTMLEYSLRQYGAYITQGPWGSYSHRSCDCYDFGIPIGVPIYPLMPGTVIVSEATSGVYTPHVVVIQTAYGNHRYAHLNSRAVQVGQQVGLETLLGYSGTAGTGPHLHLGLDGGTSPYSLDQVMQIAGFAVGAFRWA